MKVPVTILACVLALATAAFLFAHFNNPRPPERTIIADFHSHQSTYEQLKLLLQADIEISKVASWGIVTTKSPVPYLPPEGGFPVERFKEYLSLLSEVHGLGASRSRGPQAEPCVLVWAKGWAADTEHIAVCWLDQTPPNEVASLDDVKTSDSPGGKRQFAYRKIEGGWYLREDWR